MNIRMNVNVFGMNDRTQTCGQTDTRNSCQSIFAGSTKLADDPIAQRRKEAQKAAWKVVSDAWNSDKSVDCMQEEHRAHYAELEALKKEASAEISDITDNKEALRELYGVASDSDEQKDLELLEKAQNINAGVSRDELTGEERKRLGELYQGGLTEYQQRALELHDREVELRKQITNAEKQMRADTAAIHEISKERLKENPLLDAQKAAEDIIGAANEEIIGMAVQEAREHIEEKLEEAAEKAEENEKKKEERDERLEEQKIKRAEQEAMLAGTKEAAQKAKAEKHRADRTDSIDSTAMAELVKNDGASGEVSQGLEEIKNNMKLLEADLKGIRVDLEI